MTTNLSSKVVCVSLRTTCLGTTAKDAELTRQLLAQTHAKDGKLRATKTILGDAIKPFQSLRGEVRRYFNSVSLPGLTDDLRIITPKRLNALNEKLEEYRVKDAELVAKLVDRYDALIAQDRVDLGDAFDADLYPDVSDLHRFFSVNLTVCDLPSGEFQRIQGLSEANIDKMKAEHEKALAAVSAAARNEVFNKLLGMVRHVADKLSDPNAKKYHDSTFDNLKEYASMVSDLNITNDPQLEALKADVMEKLNYSMSIVKDSNALKAKVAADAKAIANKFGNLGGGRKLITGKKDEPEAAAA